MKHIFWLSCLLISCSSLSDEARFEDPFAFGDAVIKASLEGELASLRYLMAPDLDPETFPITDSTVPNLKRATIDLVQSIDETLIFHVGLRGESQSKAGVFWLENVDGRWLLSGWNTALSNVKTTPREDRDWKAPKALAVASLRSIPTVKPLEIPSLDAPTEDRPVKSVKGPLPRVSTRLVDVGKRCTSKRLEQRIRSGHRIFGQCYARQYPAGKQPRGRVSFNIKLNGSERSITLEETTIIQSNFSECLAQALSTLSLSASSPCQFTARLVFRPKRP